MVRTFRPRFAMMDLPASAGGWRAALLRHLQRLDLAARLSRFFAAAPDEAIARYVGRATPLFMVMAEAGGEVCGVAEVHPHADRPGAAEIALSVDADRRRRGVGWTLFARALDECGRRGIDDVWIVYLGGNEAMRRIGERAGFARVPGGDPATVTAHLIDLTPGGRGLWPSPAGELDGVTRR